MKPQNKAARDLPTQAGLLAREVGRLIPCHFNTHAHTEVKGVGRIKTLEADFRLAAALVFLKGEADDPAVIERRADEALSEISGVNVSGE
jgi:hypothetical protein